MPAAKDALDRARELLRTKQGELPPGCIAGARYLGNQMGVCLEVYLTAFAWYAQYAEKLPCHAQEYRFTGDSGWINAVEPHIPGTTKFEV